MDTTCVGMISPVVGVATAMPIQAQEMSRTENVLLGIAAGILTSALLAGVGVVLKRIVLPAYRSLTYGGIDLAGQWAAGRLSTVPTIRTPLRYVSVPMT